MLTGSQTRRLTAIAAVLSLAMCTVLAGCTTEADPSTGSAAVGEVRVGVLVPLSGDRAAAGREALQAAELAADLINSGNTSIRLPLVGGQGLPGLGNAKLKVVAADTKSSPQTGADEVARLASQENVVGVVGAYDPEVTVAASQRSERLVLPFVNGDSSAGYLTERGLEWFFRTGPTDRALGEAFFSILKRKESKDASTVTRIGVLYSDDVQGNTLVGLIGALSNEARYSVTANIPVDPDQGDYIAQAKEMRSRINPDVVFLAATSPETAVRLVSAIRQTDSPPKAIMGFGPGFSDPTFVTLSGQNAQGVCREADWSAEVAARNPTAKAVMELFQQRYNVPLSEVSAGTFTTMLTLGQAINNARSVDSQEIRSALLNLNISGRDTIMPWGGVHFDETNQNVAASGVIDQVIDRNPKVVFPRDVARTEVLWPVPKV